ncbi:hypothetical protein NC653_007834 [Populus alba x Populus x berolinensis]|uniref:Uncharacterized protein n=1 Tax=Populus alba x Populus x berolinensis TaxID=444605 RepID=A0AAD6R5B1_9ROSI|nr:hypothetical protein NC653_007834 [Populus alba x Populus x berolinensis]
MRGCRQNVVAINELESRASIETPCRGLLLVDDSIEHISYANNLTLKFGSDLFVVLQNEPRRSQQGATDSVIEG